MNSTLSTEQLLAALHDRYATKQFDATKKLSDETLHALTEALRLSPSSFGLQPWKFLIISDQSTKEKLLPHSWNQSQITDCSHVVVHCYRTTIDKQYIHDFISYTAKERGIAVEALQGYEEVITNSIHAKRELDLTEWCKRQVYISQGFLLLAAAELGVDACPMEGFIPAEYDKILGLTNSEFSSVLVTALGFRSESDEYAHKQKVRFPASDVCTFI